MRPFLVSALALLAASGAGAQTDARLLGAWTLATPNQSVSDGDAVIEEMWMEFGAEGQGVAIATMVSSGADGEQTVSESFVYTVSGDTVTVGESPAAVSFPHLGRMRLLDLRTRDAVDFARADGPVLGLDVLGDWRVVEGPAEVVTFETAGEAPPEVRFYLQDRLVDGGTWWLSAGGLAVETPGLGTVIYTSLARDGDRITLTVASGETLVLEPLAE